MHDSQIYYILTLFPPRYNFTQAEKAPLGKEKRYGKLYREYTIVCE
jgi:hypothetical protein